MITIIKMKKKGSLYTWLINLSFVIYHLSFSVACSDDWNDHYDASTQSNGTLWQAIASQSDLSNFARVAQAAGYDQLLSGSQTYTVFAPTDATLTTAVADSLIREYQRQQAAGTRSDDNTVVRQFLQNHIALYRRPVSSLTNDSIVLMNDKYALLTSTSLADRQLLTTNALYNNGLLFTLDRPLDYFPNVFEYLGHDADLDSVYRFLNSYSVYEFNDAKSVPGEIVDGQTVYLDSVSDLRNSVLQRYGLINSEDSTYWMLCPTNSEWQRLVSEYEPYFNYPLNTSKRDSLIYANTRLAILGGAFFSRTVNPDVAFQDSAVSTQAPTALMRSLLSSDYPYYTYYKPFADGGIFSGTTDVVCSNGHVRKSSAWAISKYDTFAQTIRTEGESIMQQDTLINAVDPSTTREVLQGNPFYNQVSGNSYVEVAPETPTARVIVGYKVPGLLSGMKYDIYAVFVPATAGDTLAVEETTKALRVTCRIRQTDQNGVLTSPAFRNAKNVNTSTVDAVLMMSGVELTTCSYGLSDATTKFEIQSNTDGATLRLDCIYFKPSELSDN
ncbi:MAG: fasciclin domain-containing protein [Prevotella sp.]|nr:fasciclin domain-containing protein [Prevotella sp.]